MKLQFWILLAAGLLFFFGCAAEDEDNSTPVVESVPTESEEATPTARPSNPEPPTAVFESPLSPVAAPSPTTAPSENSTPVDLLPTIEPPEPEEEVGAVYGRIIDPEGVPISDLVVRLGEVVWIEGKDGEEGLVFSDRSRSPQARTDEWGNFVITNVPPDGYGIVIMEPVKNEPLFVIDPAGDKLRIIDVEAKSVINLEEIEIDLE